MTTDSILLLAAAVAALSLKPGPGMMMLMSRTLAQGMATCLTFLLGYLIIGFAYLVVVFVSFNIPGLDMLFISILMKSIAAVYLVWIGIKGLKDIGLNYSLKDIEGHSFFDNLSSAMMISISNPLVIVFYAGILPTFINIQSISIADMAVVIFVVLFIEGVIPIFYCLPLALFRRKLPEKFLRGMLIFSSVMIILVGLYIGYTAILSEDVLSVF